MTAPGKHTPQRLQNAKEWLARELVAEQQLSARRESDLARCKAALRDLTDTDAKKWSDVEIVQESARALLAELDKGE